MFIGTKSSPTTCHDVGGYEIYARVSALRYRRGETAHGYQETLSTLRICQGCRHPTLKEQFRGSEAPVPPVQSIS